MNLYAFFSIIQLLLQFASVNSFILPAAPSNILARKNNEDSKNNNRLLHIGKCINPDQHIHTETVIVENGGLSTLNGTLEVSGHFVFVKPNSIHYCFPRYRFILMHQSKLHASLWRI